MKLKTRLFIATVLMYFAFSTYQIGAIEKTYGIENTTRESLSNSMQVLSRLTERSYHKLQELIREDPDEMEEAAFLEEINEKLEEKGAYLLVRKERSSTSAPTGRRRTR